MKNILYLANIKEITSYSLWEWLLTNSSDEKKHFVQKFSFLDDKKRSILGEYLLKLALKENQITDYQIKRTKHGKPFLKDIKDFKFNISHSGDWVVLACNTNNKEIGVDVEKICDTDYDGISKRFFSNEEYEFLNNYSIQKEALKIFYMLWTLKESYVKMLGVGFSIPLNSFSVIKNSVVKKQIRWQKKKKICYLKNIEILKGYQLSISSEDKEVEVSNKYKLVPLHQLIYL